MRHTITIYSLSSLKGGVVKGDSRSLDYSYMNFMRDIMAQNIFKLQPNCTCSSNPTGGWNFVSTKRERNLHMMVWGEIKTLKLCGLWNFERKCKNSENWLAG